MGENPDFEFTKKLFSLEQYILPLIKTSTKIAANWSKTVREEVRR